MVGVLVALLVAAVTTAAPQAHPPRRCLNQKCGNVSVPYPFGIDSGCYREEKFFINCSQSTNPPIAYLGEGNLPVTNISLEKGELQIQMLITKDCYDQQGEQTNDSQAFSSIKMAEFTISATKNRFMAVGCDTNAIFGGYRETEQYMSGCTSFCQSIPSVNDSCSGIGCCQTYIPSGLTNQNITLESFYNHKYSWNFNPCSFAFVVENGQFTFSGETSFQVLSNTKRLPMILNWEIGNESCSAAKKRVDYPCHNKTTKCVDRIIHNKPASSGYFCQCLPGYQGNPYLPDGCQDIDECETSNPCDNGTCHNLDGSYYCKCNSGYRNHDPKTCIPGTKNTALKISLGVCLSFLVLLVLVFWIYCGVKRRKFKKQQEKFFKQNGGLLLRQQLTRYNGSIETASIFSEEDLKKMTDHYDEKRKIGEGGSGLVYKGILPADKREVAIKMSKVSAPITDSLEFANEVILLSQINHKNVVKLLGCCLETQTPILVYEFISNGTLYDHLHGKDGKEKLSLESRLKIASGTAEALSYLHHSISNPIIHRDVKAMNILLDKNYVAKVADFGASRLVLEDQNQLATLVQGTLGYLDPEYLQSHILTDKSDVYSFGVVLAELLTGKKALIKRKNEAENLANVFVCAMKEGRLAEILDADVVKEEHNFETIVEKVANLAKKCIALRGEERPPMNEVAVELLGLVQIMGKNTAGEKVDDIQRSSEDTDHLLGSPAANYYDYVLDVRGEVGDSASIAVEPYDHGR
ncbi:PREDICTED: wall-associated receptor kinase 2-like [Prunus mume]|uniref:Wall-associated receptor kinase 2-like n=1 Tax=Prunus mume TaxID=102107 RepID=A0ABM0NJA7_PRUMU|nr:PREDICTED: wall-associated receptor kinase 2-like [Prunus mume]